MITRHFLFLFPVCFCILCLHLQLQFSYLHQVYRLTLTQSHNCKECLHDQLFIVSDTQFFVLFTLLQIMITVLSKYGNVSVGNSLVIEQVNNKESTSSMICLQWVQHTNYLDYRVVVVYVYLSVCVHLPVCPFYKSLCIFQWRDAVGAFECVICVRTCTIVCICMCTDREIIVSFFNRRLGNNHAPL